MPYSIAWAGEAPLVHSTGAPTQGQVTLNLEEQWRIGGDSEAEGEFFGVIGDLVVGPQGNLYLLDRQLMEIKIFSPEGTYVRTIGREGEGPGEFRNPSGLFILPNGNVGVTQIRSDQVTVLDPEGNPQESLTLYSDEGLRMVFQAGPAGPNFMVAVMHQRIGEGTAELLTEFTAFDGQGNPVGTYHTVNRKLDFSSPVLDETENTRPLWSADAQGNVDFISDYGQYAVHRFSPDGTKTRVLTRDYEPLPRTEADKEEMRSRFVIRGPIDPKIVVADNHPDIQDLYTTPDGGLWVLTSRGARPETEGALGTWDVYDPQGTLTHQVTLRGEGNALGDGLVFSGDRLYVIRGQDSGMRSMFGGGGEGEDEDGYAEPMEVICYKIPAF